MFTGRANPRHQIVAANDLGDDSHARVTPPADSRPDDIVGAAQLPEQESLQSGVQEVGSSHDKERLSGAHLSGGANDKQTTGTSTTVSPGDEESMAARTTSLVSADDGKMPMPGLPGDNQSDEGIVGISSAAGDDNRSAAGEEMPPVSPENRETNEPRTPQFPGDNDRMAEDMQSLTPTDRVVAQMDERQSQVPANGTAGHTAEVVAPIQADNDSMPQTTMQPDNVEESRGPSLHDPTTTITDIDERPSSSAPPSENEATSADERRRDTTQVSPVDVSLREPSPRPNLQFSETVRNVDQPVQESATGARAAWCNTDEGTEDMV